MTNRSLSNQLPLITLILAIVALVIASVCGIMLYQYSATTQSANHAILEQHLENKANIKALMDQSQQQQQQLLAVQSSLTGLQRSADQQAYVNLLIQTSYLINQANLYLSLEHNPVTSAKLLQVAISRLDKISSAALFNLKRSLTQDLQKLNNVPHVDISDTILKLDALNTHIQNQPVIDTTTLKTTPADTTASTKPVKQKWWKRIWPNADDIKSFFNITRINKPVRPLTSPQEQVYLKQNIETQLLLAEWAVIHHNDKVYQTALNNVKTWYQQYFVTPSDNQVVLTQIDTLIKLNIAPKLPDISDSLEAISHALKSAALSEQPPKATSNQPSKTKQGN